MNDGKRAWKSFKQDNSMVIFIFGWIRQCLVVDGFE
jgi:hypothetical protein